MSQVSNAIPPDAVAAAVGYEVLAEQIFDPAANLPQRAVVIAEAATANQTGLPKTFTALSAKQVADVTGYGCPAWMVADHLFKTGNGVVFPVEFRIQASDVAATPTTTTITATTAGVTKNATHYVVINGKRNFNGKSMNFTIATTDDQDAIATKIANAITSVIYSPVGATVNGGIPNQVDITTLWEGATSAGLLMEIETDGNDAGVSYAIGANVDGAGVVDISEDIKFGEIWNTLVCNTYGEAQFSALENENGTPLDRNGRYDPLVWKPFYAIWGSSLSTQAELEAITDAPARVNQVTNWLYPAHNSKSWDFEIAAVGLRDWGNIAHTEPHLDLEKTPSTGLHIPDNDDIGEIKDYPVRDALKKKGCSTSVIQNGQFVCENFVSTYHPEDNEEGYFTECRGLNIDSNVKFSEFALQKASVKGKLIGDEDQIYTVGDVIKPSQFRNLMNDMLDGLAEKGIIQNAQNSKDNLLIIINPSNNQRFDTRFPYTNSEVVKIISNTASKTTLRVDQQS
jgi:phage tail sheath gpL-like